MIPTVNHDGISGVRVVNPLEISDWDTQLGQFPAATFFHTAAWARVLHGTYGFAPAYFTRTGAEGRPSLLSAMEVNSWLTGRRGISLPFTDECEPLCSDPGSFQDLWQEALGHAQSRGWKYWECRGGRSWFGGAPASTTFWGHQLDLRDGESALFDRTDGAVRRAVRKAEQSGVTVEFSRDPGSMHAFHELLARTRRRHGVPVQPFDFFKKIQQHVLAPGHGWVVLARHRGMPVAGAVFFHFNRTVLYKFGASDERFQSLRVNNLIMWRAIQKYASESFARLDFGRTSLGNEGLRRFKLGWGANERRIEYVRQDPRTGAFLTTGDGSSGWYNRIFRVLPIFLSRLIGAILYKHIA